MSALERCRSQVVADYVAKTPRSKELFERASRVMPGGASGNLRYYEPYPLYMTHGGSCRTFDIDGGGYVDCFACNGPLLLGHRHPAVLAGVDQLQSVGSMVVNPEILVECAEKLCSVIPCAERVRFLNSGTEAVMTAVRYARAFTGKDKVVKFHGHYHGQDDPVLVGLTPGTEPFGDGIPKTAAEGTLLLPFNDEAALARLLASRDDVAAVILDPAMHAGGLWGAPDEYLVRVRELTGDAGVVLIFDEVITGFRLGLGGAQEASGVTPDLATLGKALSAGEKLSAVVGSAEVMAVTDPLAAPGTPRAFQSGTGNDGTMALAAALGAIGEYERLAASGEYAALFGRVEGLESVLHELFSSHGIDLHVNRLASMMQLFLTPEPPSFEAYAALDNTVLDTFFLALINEGVILSLPTSNHIYFSFAHDDGAFDEIERAVRAALDKYPFTEAYRESL